VQYQKLPVTEAEEKVAKKFPFDLKERVCKSKTHACCFETIFRLLKLST